MSSVAYYGAYLFGSEELIMIASSRSFLERGYLNRLIEATYKEDFRQ